MTNIVIKDLEDSKELDRKAMVTLVGGLSNPGCGVVVGPGGSNGYIGSSIPGPEECIGTFLVTNANGEQEMVQRFRCHYYRIEDLWIQKERSYVTSICGSPC
ncbi:hypothetical protein [Desulfonema magnum]|uniref:hypothetical protein n=1 Tax=Desulfonema magnum TaxID=45655 RepID=UPI001A9AE0CB|nr:hypothetical protein [Desulfonema magnum]